MGRPKTPLAMLKNTGQYRKDRHGDRREPEFTAARTPPPRPKSLTDVNAQALWGQIAPTLFRSGVATLEDLPALTTLCELHGFYLLEIARYRMARAHNDQGEHLRSALAVLNQLKDFLARFGLTPRDRTRITQAEPTKKDARELKYFSGTG